MCGLTGFWTHEDASTETARVTALMCSAIEHRGPDDQGIWSDPDSGPALGFRRLAIIDVSPAGHQPMASATGRYVVVFNGEIYNFSALRASLGDNVQ